MVPISNLNSVLIKNYGAQTETLAIIRELTKLGLIKTKSKSNKERKPKMIEDLKQESDMIASTKTLEGKSSSGFPLRLIESGMTPQQLEDINRVNSARFAQLESAANIQRQEIGGLSGMAQGFFSVINPLVERFRGSTFPAQQSGAEPIDPFATRRPNVIYLSDIPETSDVPMTRTPNPNSPEVDPQFATTTFPVEEIGNIAVPEIRKGLEPRDKMGGMSSSAAKALNLSPEFIKRAKLNDAADKLGLPTIPKISAKKPTIQKYYNDLTDRLQIEDIIAEGSKDDFFNEITGILEGYISE